MVEPNNGQLLSGRDDPKPRGAYTSERLSVRKEQAIINALANGEPIERIARRLHCSKHTAMAVRERKSDDIARRKQAIVERSLSIAEASARQLERDVLEGRIRGVALVPVFGVAVDKMLRLLSDPALFVQHQHAHVVEHHLKPMTFEDYLRGLDEIGATAPASPRARCRCGSCSRASTGKICE